MTTDQNGRSPEARLARRRRLARIVFAVVLSGTALSTVSLPRLLSPLFNGPEGVRWLTPFLLWMGLLAAGYAAVPAFLDIRLARREYYRAWGAVLFFGGMIVFVALQRFSSGIWYLETYNETMAIRISQGRSIYPDPRIGPVGSVYTPFYFLITGLLHLLLPSGYGYGRLVSLASLLLTAFLVYRITIERTRDRTVAVWAAALFLSTYAPLTKIYDFGYVDSLLMCCTCASLLFFLRNSQEGDVLALLFGGLACFTKQSALFPFLTVLGFCIAGRRRARTYWPLLFWAAVAVTLILMTKGWALTYLVEYPLAHGTRRYLPIGILRAGFLLQIPLWVGVTADLRRRRNLRFLLYAGAVLLASLSGAYKGGGWICALFPLEPLLCIAAAQFLAKHRVLLAVQLIIGLYNPFTTLFPWSSVRDADLEILEILESAQDDVWLPTEGYLYARADKKEWDNQCAMYGPGWANHPPPQRLLDALREAKFEAVVLRNNSTEFFGLLHPNIRKLVRQNYWDDSTERLMILTRR